ncbi:MAG: Co2+/Mg2+ efflux protein ApaG [Gammaproteobacteria bacterium]|nr:MAG: Co2+/Mg2+ efflux protein ApaG [Gammaproteobacteria bacterium]
MTPYRIDISTRVEYLPEQSDSTEPSFAFAYTITIRNVGEVAATLLRRHWLVTDADGREEIVDGEGVIGHQPTLEPGEVFEYTSGAVLRTPVGTMEGHYHMHAEDGTEFEAPIPVFGLTVPGVLN